MKALEKKNEKLFQKAKATYCQVLKWTTIELDWMTVFGNVIDMCVGNKTADEEDENLFSYPFAGKSSNNHVITSKFCYTFIDK